jgi:hypothetical protein
MTGAHSSAHRVVQLVMLCCVLVCCAGQVDGKTCVPCPDCADRCAVFNRGAKVKGVNTAYPAQRCMADENEFGVVAPTLISPGADECERRRNSVELYAFTCPLGSSANM